MHGARVTVRSAPLFPSLPPAASFSFKMVLFLLFSLPPHPVLIGAQHGAGASSHLPAFTQATAKPHPTPSFQLSPVSCRGTCYHVSCLLMPSRLSQTWIRLGLEDKRVTNFRPHLAPCLGELAGHWEQADAAAGSRAAHFCQLKTREGQGGFFF